MQNSGLHRHDHRLRRHPAGPEHRNLVVVDRHRVAPIGLGDVVDADHSGLPRCTGAPCTDGKRVVICTARMASAGFIGRIDTTSGPWNGPAGVGFDRCAVHRHRAIAGHVAQFDAVVDQRLLERERAADGEGDQIVAPPFAQCRPARRPARRCARPGSAADRCGYRDPRPTPECADRPARRRRSAGTASDCAGRSAENPAPGVAAGWRDWPARSRAPAPRSVRHALAPDRQPRRKPGLSKRSGFSRRIVAVAIAVLLIPISREASSLPILSSSRHGKNTARAATILRAARQSRPGGELCEFG